jgi:hypothetical protein
MTTLIPKFDFKNGGSTPTGAVNRDIDSKLGDWVSVKDFGAIGDGSNDDTSAIQAAIDYIPNGLVIFPSGTYKISASIKIKGSILGTGLATIIQPTTDTFAAFVNNATSWAKFSIKGLFINYGVATGNVQSTNTASAGFYFTGTSNNFPYEFSIEEVWIRYPYYGYRDISSSYMFTLNNIRCDFNAIGFALDTNGKTTIIMNNCYVTDGSNQAYSFYGIDGLIFTAGGFDRCNNTTSGANLFYVATCQGVNLSSIDFENNIIGNSYTSAFAFTNCNGVSISGMRGYANTFATGTNEVYGIYFVDGTVGYIANVIMATGSDVSTGTGKMYSVYVTQNSSITIDACNLTPATGTSGTKTGLTLNGTSKALITQNNTVSTENVLDTHSQLVNNYIPLMSSDNGDTSPSVISGFNSSIQLFNTPLTTTRAVYLGTTGLYQGAQFTVVRTSAASGASGLQIYDQSTSTVIKTLSAGQWATVTYTGTAWIETATGTV